MASNISYSNVSSNNASSNKGSGNASSSNKGSGGKDENYVKLDPTGFNKKFEDNENKNKKNLLLVQQNLDDKDIEIITLPHKEPVERIILD